MTVDELLEAYDDAQEGVRQAQTHARAVRDQLNAAVRDAGSDTELMWRLYWFSEASATAIADALGVKANELGRKLQPGVLVPCWKCATPTAAGSRSEVKNAIKARRYPGDGPTCAGCLEARAAQSVAWSEQRKWEDRRRRDLATMPYHEYLRTPEWDDTRRAALKRARYKCQLCGRSGVRLNVHHNTYDRRGHELNADLLTLCADCHKSHHGIKT